MTKLDLAIRVGTVVTASDTFRADVGIFDGRIVAVAAEIEEPPARDDAQRAFRSRARSICSTTLPIFSPGRGSRLPCRTAQPQRGCAVDHRSSQAALAASSGPAVSIALRYISSSVSCSSRSSLSC